MDEILEFANSTTSSQVIIDNLVSIQDSLNTTNALLYIIVVVGSCILIWCLFYKLLKCFI